MTNIKSYKLYFLWLIASAIIINITGCSKDDAPKPLPPPPVNIEITADRLTIKANGKDSVKFVVTANEKEISSSVQILQKNDSTALSSLFFSTNKSGTYTFYTMHDGKKSNEISIEATHIPVSLSVDKENIKANNKDVATFTITADGEDVTNAATIYMVENTDSLITESSFSTKNSGSYTFYATYNDQKTNEINIEATSAILQLAVDKNSIKANNTEKVNFTVTADGENVTSASEIYLVNDTPINTTSFYTDEAAIYTFYAIYDGEKTTNEVQIEATYVELQFLMQYCIMQIASTTCPNCPRMAEEIKKYISWNKEIHHTIVFHPYGRYCNSALAGALASTSIQFGAIAGITEPPAGIVDLHGPFMLKPTTTQQQIIAAMNESTATRNWEAKTGIAIQSSVNNDLIDFTVHIKTTETNDYRFFAFVVEDHIIHEQSAYVDGEIVKIKDFEHNNVATYKIEGDPLNGVPLGKIEKGKEATTAFSINTAEFNTNREVNFDNYRIVAYTLRMIGDKYHIDNVTSCPVNGGVSYKYK